MFNVCLLSFVQMYFHDLFTIQLNTNALTNDFSGKYQIIQNSIIHPRQSTTKQIKKLMIMTKKYFF